MTQIIVDSSEIYVHNPPSPYLNSESYSHYKSTTTFKGVIGIMSPGAVTFVSTLFSGSVSNKALFQKSRLLEPEDQFMGDKSFLVKDG